MTQVTDCLRPSSAVGIDCEQLTLKALLSSKAEQPAAETQLAVFLPPQLRYGIAILSVMALAAIKEVDRFFVSGS